MKFIKRATTAAIVLVPLSIFADGTPPLDLTSTGTTVAGYVAVAAGIGLGVFAAIYGVRVIIKSFKTVAK